MTPPNSTVSALFVNALQSGRRSWRSLLIADLLYKLVAFALFTPLVAAALRGGLSLAGRPAIADQEILYFLLRPGGFLILVILAALGLALVSLEQASLMVIGAGAAAGSRVTASQALAWVAGRALPVLLLAVRLVARTLLLASPFLAGLAGVWFLLLREFDINYYLKARPPAFFVAAALVGLLVAGMLRVLVPRIVGWILALPLVLFEKVSPLRALGESERRIEGRRKTATLVFLGWAAGALALAFSLPPLLFGLGRLLGAQGKDNVAIVLPLMLLVAVLWALVNALVTWINASFFALLLVGLFEHCGGRAADAIPVLREEERELPFRRGSLPLPRKVALLALVALAAAGLGGWLLLGVRGQHDVVVIAHRGASASAPENTLAAVGKALDEGTDFVEIDVQETADDEIVVHHDSDFMKVARNPLKIWDATRADLGAIDIGSWFAPEFAEERVPLLRDVLERARGRGRVTIELKTYGHGRQLERRVVELVDEMKMADRVNLMSLDAGIVKTLRELRPEWTTGLLASKAVGDLTAVDADFVAVHAGIASRSFIRRAHARGKKVYAWTVNDPVRMFQLANRGIDGLITDRPALAKEVLARRARLGSLERLLVGLAFHFGVAAPDLPASASGA